MNWKDDENLKYIKRKESSKSKANRKSKHKHIYTDCLLIESGSKPYKAKYCELCGKIDNVNFYETRIANDGTYITLKDEELFEKYKDIPHFYVDSIWIKMLTLDHLNEKE